MSLALFDDPTPVAPVELPPAHYYGNYVRRLFLAGGAIMIFGYPFFKTLIDLPTWFAIACVLVVSIFSGLQTPRHRWSALVNTAISTIAFCAFEYKGTNFYLSTSYPENPLFFWMNQLLAIIFFFALYFSIKSTRATVVAPPETKKEPLSN
jgi:hypothetical protein